MEPIIGELEQRINSLLEAEPELFLVEVRIKPTNNIKVYIDGDQGVSIDKLSKLNRTLYRQLEEENLFPGGDFSLEVSSSGLDEPLKLERQYLKNIGRNVDVLDKEGVKRSGKLVSVNADQLVLEEIIGKGKKISVKEHVIAMDQIKTTKVQTKF
jgi:ribosome maturation factor RimP